MEFVGLCDINPLRVEVAKADGGVVPDLHDFDRDADHGEAGPPDGDDRRRLHSEFIVRAMERGVDVMTEKPMVIDEKQCQAVLDAEKKSGRKIVVTFNYRYAPKHQTIKELLMARRDRASHLRRLLVVSRHPHGADYFRRWHRLRSKSGSLWVHKAPPLRSRQLVARRRSGQVSAFGNLRTTARAAPSVTRRVAVPPPGQVPLLLGHHQGPEPDGSTTVRVGRRLQRDGCVFKEDIDIFDTMNAIVRYSNGVNMSYSVNTFMPIEGYCLAFNGTKGRLEVRDYERQAWDPGEETEMYLIKNFGQREKIEPKGSSARRHGGGDTRLRDLIFRQRRHQPHAASGIARRRDVVPDRHRGAQEHRRGAAIKIADLVRFA